MQLHTPYIYMNLNIYIYIHTHTVYKMFSGASEQQHHASLLPIVS